MARAKKATVKPGEIDLGADIGLTLYGDTEFSVITDRLPTMLPQLDYIFGGGLPFGRMVEVMGKNASGKSTFAVHLTKIAQMLGVPTVWVDAEGTADPVRLAELGVDFGKGKNVYLVEPEKDKDGVIKKDVTVELVATKLQEVMKAFALKGMPIMIIWDSVAHTPSATELEKGVGNKQPGIKAKALAQFSQIIAPLLTNSKTLFVVINQARDEMGSMFGGVESPGGHAFKHWASIRMETQQASQIKSKEINAFGAEEETYIGHMMRVKTLKSKVSRPRQNGIVYLMSDTGLDLEENIYRSCFATNKQYSFISGGTWKAYTTDAGQEIKFNNDKAWVSFLKSPEGQPVRDELFAKMMLRSFPNGYVPFTNSIVDIRKIPLYAYTEEYMKTHTDVVVAPKADTPVEATDVSNLLNQV